MKQIKSFVSNKSSRPVDGKAAPRRIVALATERRSQLRKDVLIALIEAGVKGVDTLMNVQRRRYLALEASVPPMVTGNGVRALQSNALKDAFVSETKVTLDAVTCGSVSRHWTVLGSALVVYNRRDRSVLRTDLGANSYRSYMASRRLTIIAFFLVAAIIAFLAITTPLPQLATWLEDRVPPALPLIGHFIIVIIFACFLVITHLSSQKKKRSTGIVVKVSKQASPCLMFYRPVVHAGWCWLPTYLTTFVVRAYRSSIHGVLLVDWWIEEHCKVTGQGAARLLAGHQAACVLRPHSYRDNLYCHALPVSISHAHSRIPQLTQLLWRTNRCNIISRSISGTSVAGPKPTSL
jgi:hypothetical protein